MQTRHRLHKLWLHIVPQDLLTVNNNLHNMVELEATNRKSNDSFISLIELLLRAFSPMTAMFLWNSMPTIAKLLPPSLVDPSLKPWKEKIQVVTLWPKRMFSRVFSLAWTWKGMSSGEVYTGYSCFPSTKHEVSLHTNWRHEHNSAIQSILGQSKTCLCLQGKLEIPVSSWKPRFAPVRTSKNGTCLPNQLIHMHWSNKELHPIFAAAWYWRYLLLNVSPAALQIRSLVQARFADRRSEIN